jgi:hypothetical protein
MDLLKAKAEYGDLYRVVFEDNTTVVFRLLSFKEYEHYYSLYFQGLIGSHDISIFEKCKVQIIQGKEEELKAGIIYTITNIILRLSGPSSIEDWATQLKESRNQLQNIKAQVEMIICKAFPAYRPEDIWDMKWDQIVHRLAQAEAILLQTGILKEPIKVIDPKNHKFEDLVKEAKDLKQFERNIPIGNKHPIGRDSNWDQIQDYPNPKKFKKR